MKTLQKKGMAGFTIIELMIALVIIAILVALAYPSYVNYVRKSNRGEAQQLLMNWAINQEIWRSNHTGYASSTDIAVPTNDRYNFSVVLGNPLADPPEYPYTLIATAQGDQAKDESRDGQDSCEILNLRSDGRKYSNNDEDVSACWD